MEKIPLITTQEFNLNALNNKYKRIGCIVLKFQNVIYHISTFKIEGETKTSVQILILKIFKNVWDVQSDF